jgi:hypothetical protein
MKISILCCRALSFCALPSLLAGCGGSQPPLGAPGAMPLQSAQSSRQYEHTSPLLYVTNFSADYNDVKIYHANAKDPNPLAIITNDIDTPADGCLDAQGTLYVTNEPVNGVGWISEYPAGKTKAAKVITKGIDLPGFCGIDGKGNLWVTNVAGPDVTEYLAGSTKPHTAITKGMVYPVGIAIDHEGNIYVSNRPSEDSGNVEVYPPGGKSPTRTITEGVSSPVGITVDANGILYVTNINENTVEEYRFGKSQPYREITKAMDQPCAVTVNKNGYLYVTNYANNVVVEFAPGSTTPSNRQISKGLYTPEGTAYYPPLLP